jgi:signal transduction histidine kinase
VKKAQTIRVLLVEDNLADVRLIQAMTAEVTATPFEITHESRLGTGLRRLQAESYDLLLLDLGLPDSQGLSTFALAHGAAHSLPIIVLTGDSDDQLALEALRSGAQDYLVKGDVDGRVLMRAIRYAIERKQIETENVRLLMQVRAQARQIQQILDSVPEGICLLDAQGCIQLVNPQAEHDLRQLAGVGTGSRLTKLGDVAVGPLLVTPTVVRGLEITSAALPGRYFSAVFSPLVHEGVTQGWILLLREITQEREQQARLQSQERLAALGQMAAGIAHDFNNILSIISLYTEILRKNPQSIKRDHYLAHILAQTQNAATMVRQILDFGRRSIMRYAPLDMALFLVEMQQLLRNTLPESIVIEVEAPAEPVYISADRTYLEQVILNLSANARDAMPGGCGTLTLSVDTVVPKGEALSTHVLAGKDWVRLRVEDTGTGIAPAHLAHIFEPYFTTKGPESGTGLGLPQVYGIIKQHGGEIDVESQVGVGTTFTIYLPAAEAAPSAQEVVEADLALRGTETILIVEDEDTLRSAVAEALSALGYTVLTATNGREAVDVITSSADAIDLVVSDIVMPEVGGMQLHAMLTTLFPELPVILTTGYPLDAADQEYLRNEPTTWLYKPYSVKSLVRQIRTQLAITLKRQ